MSIPKDIDHVSLEVTRFGKTLLSEEHDVGPDGLLIPATFSLHSLPSAGGSVVLKSVAYREGEARIERSAVTPIPRGRVGEVRLSLNYLCDGSARVTEKSVESTCPEGETCVLGSCVSRVIPETELPIYEPSQGLTPEHTGIATDLSAAVLGDRCFDVNTCFTTFVENSVDASRCTLEAPADLAVKAALNVALRLPLGSKGLCTERACWIVLDRGIGWTLRDGRIDLPPSICSANRDAIVVTSRACASKTESTPLCGAWSPVKTPLAVSAPPRPVGEACSGPSAEECGQCGMRTRTCTNGTWSAWSSCWGEGACAPNTARPCGNGGRQECGLDCQWSACAAQTCPGAASQSCGNCGTETRVCDSNTGLWSAWSACSDQGACAPGAAQSCGEGGSQTCAAQCQWNACQGQVCSGPASRACGRCGTETRTCSNGIWSDWGACSAQGECEPGSTESCTSGGSHSCGGNCRYGACVLQTCAGAASRACANCGTESRTCNNSTGIWSAWSGCAGAGVCAPDAARACGSGGSEGCGGNCQWSGLCSGQRCTGEAARGCGNCGSQTRSCGDTSGAWSAWSECAAQGACAVMSSMACGENSAQSCGALCQWSACACTGSLRACGATCVDTQTDRNNCGGCGNVCQTGGGCQQGRCVCPAETHACGGVCASDRDLTSCGPTACSAPCPEPTSGAGSATCDGTRCGLSCDGGNYLDGTDCTPWSTCPAGSFVRVAGTPLNDRICELCPPRTFSSAPNSAACVSHEQCAAGTRQVSAGTGTTPPICGVCSAGQYCPGGAIAPTACGNGDWDHDGNPATQCLPWASCASGSYASTAGTATVNRACTACANGTFNTMANAPACTAWTNCAAGRYVSRAGSTTTDRACADCSAGTFSAAPNLASCSPHANCVAGQYVIAVPSATTNRSCGNCPDTTGREYSTVTNAASCSSWTTCSPGSYVATVGTTSADRACRTCAANTFSTMNNAPQCLAGRACPPGSYQTSPATVTVDAVCALCGAGFYCPGGALPRMGCTAGSWDDDANPASACVPWRNCTAGEYVSAPLPSATTDRSCSPCIGGFSTSANAAACTPFTVCNPSQVLATPGTPMSDSQCAPRSTCTQGMYISGTTPAGDSICSPCGPGSYSAVPNAVVCTLCAAGTATPSVASTMPCAACTGNSFQPSPGQATCIPRRDCAGLALGNTSPPNAAQDSTCVCPSGQHTVTPGSGGSNPTCAACDPGTFSSANNASTCSGCTTGYSGSGATSCTPWAPACSSGQYESTTATATRDRVCMSYTSCPAGSGASGGTPTSDRMCVTCAAGTASAGGSNACTSCTGNTISGTNASTCIVCGTNASADAAHTTCTCDPGYVGEPPGPCIPAN